MINPIRAVFYAGYIVMEVLKGAFKIAWDVLTPGLDINPAILELPLQCETDLEISLMASSITITPGTLTVGIAPGVGDHPPSLFVQAIYGEDPDEVLTELRDMERRLLIMTRGKRAGEAKMSQGAGR